MKICTVCKVEKPETEFYRSGFYLRSRCKACHRKVTREDGRRAAREEREQFGPIACLICGDEFPRSASPGRPRVAHPGVCAREHTRRRARERYAENRR